MIWNEWVMELLYNELAKKLEKKAYRKTVNEDVQEGENGEEQ